MNRQERALSILNLLQQHYPDSKTALAYRTPFQLLVAVILSAQCTDARVNIVTKELFKDYGTPQQLAAAKQRDIEKLIFSTGFYRAKSTHIIGMAKKLLADYGGTVPQSMDELLTLPGVARKTANVVLSAAFHKNEGIAVDTHVIRLTNRWKLTTQHDPNKIEQDLLKLVPQEYWGYFSWATILHGRAVCFARKPACADCPLQKICPSAFRI